MSCLIYRVAFVVCVWGWLTACALAENAVVLGGASGSCIDIPESTGYRDFPMSVELQIQMEACDQFQVLGARGAKQAGHWELYVTPADGFLCLYAPDLNPPDVQTNVCVADGAPHRIGWSCDGSNSRLFVDGVEALNTGQTGVIAEVVGKLRIGALVEGGLNSQGIFTAMRISNAVRDLTEVGTPLSADGQTIGLWQSSTLNGLIFPDASTTGRDGTWVNPPLVPTPMDDYVALGGTDCARLYIDKTSDFGSVPLSVEMWLQMDASAAYNVPVCRGLKQGGHWEMYTTPGDGRLAVYAPDLAPSDIVSQSVVCGDAWHVIAFSYDGATVRIYADGIEVMSVGASGIFGASAHEILVGGLADGSLGLADGKFAAMRISNVVRDLSNVNDFLSLNVDQNTIGLWRASDLADGMIEDATGGGNTMYLVSRNEPGNFETMLDETEREEQLALPMSGNAELDAELALDLTQVAASEVGTPGASEPRTTVSLNGHWFLTDAQPGTGELAGLFAPGMDRSAWLTANVPMTVQKALFEAGEMSDPFFGIRTEWPEESKEWWFVREFTADDSWQGQTVNLYFDGVDYTADFYLNGEKIGYHRGMFGGPEFDVTDKLQYAGQLNTLAVAIAPPPSNWAGHPKPSVVYGWHYGHMISMGVWRDVELQIVPNVELRHPRVETKSLDGTVDVELMVVSHHTSTTPIEITLDVIPWNHTGNTQSFKINANVPSGKSRILTTLNLNDPKIWWPMGYGEQPLYRLEAAVSGSGGEKIQTLFGLRTLEMEAAPGCLPNMYRWQFVINGKEMFIKGANWCFFDPMLVNDPAKYEHILTLVERAGIQMLRVWGGGPIEDDVLYDICNRRGIMVWQEFSYCFSVPDIPTTELNVLDDQAMRTVRRLRNHPCLALWGGGNEVQPNEPLNNGLKYLGKRIRQLDPTRPYHITSPWGGDLHNWNIFHSGTPIEDYQAIPSVFMSEYGLPSSPNRQSVLRYVNESSISHWPPTVEDTDLINHSQQFSLGDWGKVMTYAGDYGPIRNWDEYILYSQMAQADAFRYGAEMTRASAKHGTTGFFFYKTTDIFPGQAWSIIDFYGVPKLSYYRTARFMRPVNAYATYEKFDYAAGEAFSPSIHVANDSPNNLADASVRVTLFDAQGQPIFDQTTADVTVVADGQVELNPISLRLPEQVSPMLLSVTLTNSFGQQISESWYWFNYADLNQAVADARALPHWGYPVSEMSWVFEAYANLPQSRLNERYPQTSLLNSKWRKMDQNHWTMEIRNDGAVPAFMITIDGLPDEYGYYLSDNAFCLRPGAKKQISLELPVGVELVPTMTIKAWNSEESTTTTQANLDVALLY